MRVRLRWARFKTPHLETALLLVLVTASFVLAVTDFNHFGSSWDEDVDYRYARQALAAYRGQTPDWDSLGAADYLELHGPAYLMGSEVAAQWLVRVRPGWSQADARHFTNHLMFLVAVVFIYHLGSRLAGRRVGLLAAVLMLTQPLLLGHSFINQKDIPFMALFLAAVVLGLRVDDRLRATPRVSAEGQGPLPGRLGWGKRLASDWRHASRGRRVLLSLAVGAAVALTVELLWVRNFVLPFLQSAVTAAYHGHSVPVINRWFDQLAQNADRLPIEAYLQRLERLYRLLRFFPITLACLGAVLAWRAVFPSVAEGWSPGRWKEAVGQSTLPPVLPVVIAGAILGFAVSTRSPGIFAGVLVTLLLLRHPGRAWTSIALYWTVAALVCLVSWPYLWGDPIFRFAESLRSMSAFPWQGDILYAGALWDAGTTPWHYVPFLVIAQTTLPIVAAFGVGVAVAAFGITRRSLDRPLVLILIVWLCVPLAAAVALRSTVYDNTRQFLFILPPIFLLAGLGLDWILRRVHQLPLEVLIIAVVLTPGLTAILRLHPYEYIYYNALVGGTRGAFRSYETDYWCTAYRQAMERLNQEAPPGATVAVWGPLPAARAFARPDLIVRGLNGDDPAEGRPDFVLACTRSNLDLGVYPETEAFMDVNAGGAVLAVVKDLRRP